MARTVAKIGGGGGGGPEKQCDGPSVSQRYDGGDDW